MTIRAGWGPNPKTPIGMPPRLLPLTQQLKAFSSVTNEASSGKFGFPRIKETSFETQWRNLTEAQRDQLEKEYADVGKMDWLYTIAYGSPEIKDGSEGKKVFLGTVGFLAASVGLFAFLRSFAKPGPDSMTPEGKEARLQYMREQNANPIRGISSKKDEIE